MSLTVRQLLEIPEFAEVKVICGTSGLDRIVTCVNVMEAPDIAQWLHGGELLLSTGYQFRNHPMEFDEFVRDINKAGVAALGFKNRFLSQFPAHAKDLAESLGMPILSLPIGLPYSDIIRTVILKTDEVENIRFSESVLRSFSQIIAEGGNVTQILQNLVFFLRSRVSFLDAVTGQCVCVDETGTVKTFSVYDANAMLKKYPYERLSLSKNTYGYFIFEQFPSENLARIVIGHAKTAMLLAIQKDIATKQVESRYRDEFIQDLLTNNVRYQEEILSRAARFGWDMAGPLRCIIFSIDDYKRSLGHNLSEEGTKTLEETRQKIYSLCKQEMRYNFAESPYSTMSDSIVFLLNTNKYSDFKTKIKLCAKHINKISEWSGFTITTGIGDEKNDFLGCAASYKEAKRSIEMMRPFSGGSNVYFWEDLGLFTILSLVCKTKEAHKFCHSKLNGVTSDLEQNKELLSTLQILIDENWNLKSAARALDIHYNTVRYRYEKLSELFNMDLSNSTCRLEIAIALKLCRLNPNLYNS